VRVPEPEMNQKVTLQVTDYELGFQLIIRIGGVMPMHKKQL
jgi:hypothetical protein